MTQPQPDVLDINELQALGEGVQLLDQPTVEFLGATFRLRDKIGKMALMRFAAMANSGAETGGMDTLAAMYQLLKYCVHEADWQRFGEHADEKAADEDDLLAVVGQAMEQATARPPQRPAVSSARPQPTSGSSKVPATLRLVQGTYEEMETAEQMRARLAG